MNTLTRDIETITTATTATTATGTTATTSTTSTATATATAAASAPAPVELRNYRTAAYAFPRRFDIHQVARVTEDLAGQARLAAEVVIDGSQVEMIDLAAITALETLMDAHAGLRIAAPSVALRATITYTGHDRLAVLFSTGTLAEAA